MDPRMDVYLIDGTYELFRHFFAVPAAADVNGQEVGAVRGVLTSVLSMVESGATHIGVATDHVVESFPDTRSVKALLRNCSFSFLFLRKRWKQWELWCGPWSNMKRTMRSLPPLSKPRKMTVSAKCSSVPRTRTSVSVLSG